MEEDIPALPLGRYRHFKGRFYEVLHLARCSESQQWLVVYRCLYGDFSLWVRPLSQFCQPVPQAGGVGPRFQWVGQAPAHE